MSYLLDTNVISELQKPKPAAAVTAWSGSIGDSELFLSSLAIGEICKGIESLRRKDEARATTYEQWMSTLKHDYGDRILPITVEVAEAWGRLNAVRTLPVIDGLMAATAHVHKLTLASRNEVDFAGTGVAFINPFSFDG